MDTIKLVSHSQATELSTVKRELLEKRLRGALKGPGSSVSAIPPRDSSAPVPLSFSQERLWLIHQMNAETCAYNLPCALRIEGALNLPAFEAALNGLIARHEILRTTIRSVEGRPGQIIHPARPAPLPVVDLQEYASHERDAHLERLVHREIHRPFNLEEGPLLRSVLFRMSERDHLFLAIKHHIISDGWSLGVFFKELEQLYHAFANRLDPQLPPLPAQYGDFATWQQQQTESQANEDVGFWKERLANAPVAVELPTDHPRPARPGFRGAQFSLSFPEPFYETMIDFNRDLGTTVFMLLMTSLGILLSKWCRQPDMVLGTVVACRTRREIEHLIGCFMNFLPVRMTFSGVHTGLDLLRQIQANIIEAHSHQDCPFEKIVDAVHPTRTFSKNPIYNVALLLQNFPVGVLSGEGIRSSFVPVHTDTSLLDLRIVAEEGDRKLSISCEYDTDLFDPGTIHYLMRSYQDVLERLLRAPETPLGEFTISEQLIEQAEAARRRGAKETLAIAATFTAEPIEPALKFWLKELHLPADPCFAPYHQVFQQLLDPGSLLARNQRGANVILLRLQDLPNADLPRVVEELISAIKGAAPRSAVPIMLFLCPTRSPLVDFEKRIAADLANVPNVYTVSPDDLNEFYPVADYEDREADALGHVPYTSAMYAAIATMIARKYHLLKRPPRKVIVLDCDNTLWAGVCGEDGPRGVRCDAARQTFQRFMRAQHRAGMLLCIASKNNEQDVDEVFASCAGMVLKRDDFAAARINWRPKSENLRSLAQELRVGLDSFIFLDDNPMEIAEVEANCPEVLALQLPEDCSSVEHWLKHLWVFDRARLTAEDRNRGAQYEQNRLREQLQADSMSMADFIAGLNLQIRVEPAEVGRISRLSQLSLRTNQFNSTTKRRSEGDLARLLADANYKLFSISVSDRFGDYGLVGMLVCELGRDALIVDSFMLSCRVLGKGVEHRMLAELGRVALAAKLRHVEVPFVATTRNKPILEFLNEVGACFRQGSNDVVLFHFPAEVAARIKFNPESVETGPLPPHHALAADPPSEHLPGARFRRYSWIARCANNAMDILKVVEEKSAPAACVSSAALQPPSSDLEKQLSDVWKALLRRDSISVRDDFFVLGGTSLLAVRLCAQIEKTLRHKVSLATLFKAPTIEQLARAIERKQLRPSRSALVAIQPKGDRPPLVLVHGAGGGILWGYSNLAGHLGSDQPVYGMEPYAFKSDMAITVEQMAVRYAKDLCAFQSKGPYYLGGYCFGGYVAYEMACYLESQGEQVALLLLLDSAAPNSGYERVPWWRPEFYPRFVRNSVHWLWDFAQLDARERRDLIQRKCGVLKRKLQSMRGYHSRPVPFTLEEFIDTTQFPEHELELWRLHLTAGSNYVPRPYGGRVLLLRTRGQPLLCSLDPHYGWGKLALGGLETRIVPGAHEHIFMEPEVQVLAREVNAALSNSQQS